MKLDSRFSPELIRFLEDYFDKILVLTIPRAVERQRRMQEKLQGLSFEFFFGVDKTNLEFNQLVEEKIYDDTAARKIDRYGKGMMLGHIACSLSHRNIYEHILSKGYRRVLIFEDDLVPYYERMAELPATFSELPAHWELLYLGYAKYEKITAALKVKQVFYKFLSYAGWLNFTPVMIDNMFPKPYSPHLRKAGFHDLTHAYAVSKEACAKLVEAQTPVVLNADPLLAHQVMKGKLKAFTTLPQFFTQEQFTDPQHRSLIHH